MAAPKKKPTSNIGGPKTRKLDDSVLDRLGIRGKEKTIKPPTAKGSSKRGTGPGKPIK